MTSHTKERYCYFSKKKNHHYFFSTKWRLLVLENNICSIIRDYYLCKQTFRRFEEIYNENIYRKAYCVYSSDPCILEGNQDSNLCWCYISSPDSYLGTLNCNHCQNIRVFYILKRSNFISVISTYLQIKCFIYLLFILT